MNLSYQCVNKFRADSYRVSRVRYNKETVIASHLSWLQAVKSRDKRTYKEMGRELEEKKLTRMLSETIENLVIPINR